MQPIETKFDESDRKKLKNRKNEIYLLNFKCNGWLSIGRIFPVERREVEPSDRIAGIEWNVVEYYRICCMARSLRSLRQVATLRHGRMARRSASLRSCIKGTRGM